LRGVLFIAAIIALNAVRAGAESAPMPDREQQFVTIIQKARESFNTAKTDEARRNARLALQIAMNDFMGLARQVDNWVGVFKNTQKTQEGDRTIEIEISTGITIRTFDARFLDSQYDTLVRSYAPLAKIVDAMKIGAPVQFSALMIGTPVAADDQMVQTPVIIARFTDLRQPE
jgi:hypothetical protein